jgi:hypothetical protein
MLSLLGETCTVPSGGRFELDARIAPEHWEVYCNIIAI